jgi:putative transcriptional regulator
LSHVTDNSVPRRARLIIDIRIDEILAVQGRTFYWLAKQTGISHTTLWRLKKGKALGMNLDTLEKMCRVLQCQPGDILILSNGKKKKTRKTESKQKR